MSVELAVMDRSTRKVLSWRVWRRDDNQNRAYPSRRTVQQDEAPHRGPARNAGPFGEIVANATAPGGLKADR
jgi:hypothetical protein